MGRVNDAARKIAQALSSRDTKAFMEAYASEGVAHDPFYPEPLRGAALREDAESYFRAFPDLRAEILTVVAQDETSGAFELRFYGTNTGPLATPQGELPPTNKRVDLKGASFLQLDSSGKIAEERRYYDSGTMMRQLGLMPEPEAMAKPEAMTAH